MISEAYNNTKFEVVDFWKYSNEELECIKLPKDSCLNEMFNSNHLKRKCLYTITGENSKRFCEFLAKSLSANTKTNILYFSYKEIKNLNKIIQNSGKLYNVKLDSCYVSAADVSNIVKSLNIDVVIIEKDNELPEVISAIRKLAVDNNITVIIQKNKLSSLNTSATSDFVLEIMEFFISRILKNRFGRTADKIIPTISESDKQFIG